VHRRGTGSAASGVTWAERQMVSAKAARPSSLPHLKERLGPPPEADLVLAWRSSGHACCWPSASPGPAPHRRSVGCCVEARCRGGSQTGPAWPSDAACPCWMPAAGEALRTRRNRHAGPGEGGWRDAPIRAPPARAAGGGALSADKRQRLLASSSEAHGPGRAYAHDGHMVRHTASPRCPRTPANQVSGPADVRSRRRTGRLARESASEQEATRSPRAHRLRPLRRQTVPGVAVLPVIGCTGWVYRKTGRARCEFPSYPACRAWPPGDGNR